MALPTRSHPPPSAPVPPYPTGYQIEEMFANRLVASIFNTYYTDPVDITVIGQDFHLSGHYNSIQRFDDVAFGELWELVRRETVRTEVIRVIGGGESAWAAVELRVTATTKYDKPFHSEFVELVRFNSQGQIAQTREFWDTGHLHNHVEEHRGKKKETQ